MIYQMKQLRPKILPYSAVLCVLVIFMVSGCGGKSQLWYKPDHNQSDFDVDHRQCMIIAQEMGRQATITGEKPDPDVVNDVYNNCLFSRGWTHTPPDADEKKRQPHPLAEIEKNRIHVFGDSLRMPDDFYLTGNRIGGFQDVQVQVLTMEGDGPVYLHMVIQEVVSRQFDPIDYPVKDPFFTFDRGSDTLEDKKRVNWAVVAGDFKGNWMAGIGAYLLMDNSRRINLTLTTDIPAPKQEPPAGLRLTKQQKQAVSSFSGKWLEYIRSGLRHEPGR